MRQTRTVETGGDEATGEPLGWAVVANVARETTHGPRGEQIREGLRHFVAGTKVWGLPAQWGDGWESALLVGRHRGSRRYVQMVVPLRHLEQFRVEAVYRPAVMRELTKPWQQQRGSPRQWQSQEAAMEAIRTHPETKTRLK